VAARDYCRRTDAVAEVGRLAETWLDSQRMGRVLGIAGADRALAQCPNVAVVEWLHARWLGRVNRRGGADGRDALPFTPPPFPGNDAIQPICCGAQLREEGRGMAHCLASYTNAVPSG
jgi:hypothetical protein